MYADNRPAIIDARCHLDYWKGNRVIDKGHRGALLALIERKSLFTVIEKDGQGIPECCHRGACAEDGTSSPDPLL